MNGYHYRGDKLFCNDCYEHGNRCGICNIPIVDHYRRNSKLYCHECYSKYPRCSVCQNITGSYIEFEDYIACKECEKEITNYKVTLIHAQSLVNRRDLLKGKNMLKRLFHPHLCDVSHFASLQNLSKYISSYAKSDFEYTKECYYFCRTEVEYFREACWNPIECIVTGKGNCSSKSGLLSSLLKARSIKVNYCEIPNHVYIIAHLPNMPKWCRMFASKKKNDGTNWIEWMGMDPASNHMIGTIPKTNFIETRLKSM